MIRTALIWAAAAAALLVTFAGTALAAVQVLPTEDSSLRDLATAVIDAFRGGHKIAAGALALFACLALAKKYVTTGKAGLWLHSDLGGTVTVFLLSVTGAIAAADSLSPAVLWTAGGVGVAAIGGYAVAKTIFKAIEASKWYATAPTWFQSVIDILTWLVDKPDAIKAAQAAGAVAVHANPATGAEGVAGAPTKF